MRSSRGLGRVGEQQVRLVEEEHELGLGLIADLGQRLPQLRQHPQQEHRIEPRLLHQLVGGEDVDDAAAVRRGAHEILDVERRQAEEMARALLLQHENAALDRADRGGRDVAVLGGQLLAALGDVVDDGAQVGEVVERHLLVGSDAEGDVEHALLHLVELEHAAEQQRAHVVDGGADRVALLAHHVPEHGRIGFVLVALEAHLLDALLDERLGLADGRDAAKVALDVGGEHGDAGIREAFGQHLQRDRLAGAGRAGDEAVAVGEPQLEEPGPVLALADVDLVVLQHGKAPVVQAARAAVPELARDGGSATESPWHGYGDNSIIGCGSN